LLVATHSAAQNAIVRLSAQHKYWVTNGETSTDAAPPGVLIYEKPVFVPASINTLYITVSATGDGHGGNAQQLLCQVDAAPCNAGSTFSATDFHWIVLQKHNADINVFQFVEGDTGILLGTLAAVLSD
jgi:hypothetical protein